MSGAPAEIVRLEGVTRTYRNGEVEVPVLRGIDLRIEAGEYVAIMGRSGAGKSTLMNILGCLDRATSGRYVLDGRDVGGLGDDALSQVRGQTIGFVFQSFHLLQSRTIVENVELPMEYQRVGAAEREARAKDLLVRVGLGHRLGHYPQQLSGGERQRVAIARSLANRPRLLLADEPTGNLDSAAQAKILSLFEELQRETGVTMIMVTHDEAIGEAARRRVLVSDGQVVEDRRR
jgi:putative ABC transport system ATP-binding protein